MSDGGLAFPGNVVTPEGSIMSVRGMSLRDYLTGQALVGLASRNEHEYGDKPYDNIGDTAVALADATLKALRGKEEGQ